MRPVAVAITLSLLSSLLSAPDLVGQGPPDYGYSPTVGDRTWPKAPPYLEELNLFFPPVPPASASYPRVNQNAKRATVDGRLILLSSGNLEQGGNLVFRSFNPEHLDDEVPLSLDTATPVGSKLPLKLADFFDDDPDPLPTGPVSTAICDAFPETPKARRYSVSAVQNPRRCEASDGYDPNDGNPVALDDAYDCYDIWIVIAFDRTPTADPALWSRPLTVAVKDPKTALATPVLAVYTDDPQKSPGLGTGYPGDEAEAPAITGDGRLLVMDSSSAGIVYSLNNGSYDPCDARSWTTFRRISAAYVDQDLLDDEYGIAEHQIRDTEGEPYVYDGVNGPEDVVRGTYPWIDRAGSNIVLSRVGAINPAVAVGGYEFVPKATMMCLTDEMIQDRVLKRIGQAGLSVFGLWSRGKMIHIDGRTNLSSYTIVQSDLERAVTRGDVCLIDPNDCAAESKPECCDGAGGCCYCGDLNNPTSGTAAFDAIQIRDQGLKVQNLYVDQGTDEVPIGQARNATLWSNENHFNYLPHMRPTDTRDVVWSLQTDRNHMDIAFDDYVSEDVLINSDMSPSISTVEHTQGGENVPYFNDGWEVEHDDDQIGTRTVGTNGYSLIPRIQNAATADGGLAGSMLVPPAYGSLIGGARIEPIALGGVKGRGVYLDGNNDWIAYELTEDGTSQGDQPWFISLWINPKSLTGEPCGGGAVGNVRRDLLHFPDGTRVFLNGYNGYIKIKNAPYNLEVTYPGNLRLYHDEWSHLAIQAVPVNGTSTALTVYLNGYQIFHSDAEEAELFRLEPGLLKIGYDSAVTCKAYRGWIDDFKVIQRQLNPEEVCRHAYGTLVATTETNDPVASQYPSSAHGVIRDLVDGGEGGRIYYCETAFPERDATSGLLGERSDSVCVRDVDRATNPDCIGQSLVFPEFETLYHDAPRPASTSNAFCTSCHTSNETFHTMDPDEVLTYIYGLDAEDDARRQPMQWPQKIHGAIPEGLMTPSQPLPYDCFSSDDGLDSRHIDHCFLPAHP